VLLGVTFCFVAQGNTASAGQEKTGPSDPVIEAFNERVKQYMKLRKKTEVPKLSDKSKPEDIEAQMTALRERIVNARSGAKPGDIFTPEISRLIRRAIKQELTREQLRRLRGTLREADTKGIRMRANAPYPETKELIEMPPALLLRLPTLPRDLQYRFVGGYLLLVDKDASLIVDVMPGAVPRPATAAR
jgi:hypothetical protein